MANPQNQSDKAKADADAAAAKAKADQDAQEAADKAKAGADAAAAKAKPLVNGADDGSGGGMPEPPPVAPPKSTAPYSVAPGTSITCARGILGPCEEITERDLPGGKEQLEYLASRGLLVKGA